MKIALTGPESSGKTSLARELAKEFDTTWIPEFAREYLEQKNTNYIYEDIKVIAEKQRSIWNSIGQQDLVFYDTEFTVLKIWSEVKFGKVDPYIIDSLENQDFDHYFICDPTGVAWVEDPLREDPNNREELFELYLRVMRSNNRSFTILTGTWEERVNQAISVVNEKIV